MKNRREFNPFSSVIRLQYRLSLLKTVPRRIFSNIQVPVSRLPPPPCALILQAPTLVPKLQMSGSCRYCGSLCVPDKMESHVKSCHKDNWLKQVFENLFLYIFVRFPKSNAIRFVKKCPEKECDFRSYKDEEINRHREVCTFRQL